MLVEGAIELTTVCDNTLKLRPNDIVDMANGDITSMRKVNPVEYTSWIHGMLYFHGVSLDSVLSKINDHYDINVICDPELAVEKIYGKLELKDDPVEVIRSIRAIVPMEVDRRGRDFILRPVEGV